MRSWIGHTNGRHGRNWCRCSKWFVQNWSVGVDNSLGVLIKGASDLEKAHTITAIIFDKTGTLTLGNPSVNKTILLDSNLTEKEFYRFTLFGVVLNPVIGSLGQLKQGPSIRSRWPSQTKPKKWVSLSSRQFQIFKMNLGWV